MSKIQTTFLCILSALLGGITGSILIGRYLVSRDGPRGQLIDEAASLLTMQVSQQLHENKIPEAIQLQESELDNRILSLAFYASEGNQQTRADARHSLRRIADYRKKYPFASDQPETRKAVEAALASALAQP